MCGDCGLGLVCQAKVLTLFHKYLLQIILPQILIEHFPNFFPPIKQLLPQGRGINHQVHFFADNPNLGRVLDNGGAHQTRPGCLDLGLADALFEAVLVYHLQEYILQGFFIVFGHVAKVSVFCVLVKVFKLWTFAYLCPILLHQPVHRNEHPFTHHFKHDK